MSINVRTVCLVTVGLLGVSSSAAAQGFSLQTGPPVAAMPDPANPGQKKIKDIAFVVRSAGCDDRATFRLAATAESLVNGTRQSTPVRVDALPQTGVFAIFSPGKAPWIVSLSGTCGSQASGAMVKLIGGEYTRDGVELLPRHPTAEDIDRALARSGGGGR